MRTYQVDGSSVTDVVSLCSAFAQAVDAPKGYFGRDLQSFDDCLFGGFGLVAPCEIVWEHSAVARQQLGTLFDEVVEAITTVSTRASDPAWKIRLSLK